MIELLTPPVPADPATPLAPAAILGDAGPVDFAALFGQVAPATPSEPAPLTEVIAPTIAQIAPIMPDTPAAEPAPVVTLAAVTVSAAVLSSVTGPAEHAPAEAAEPVKLPTLPPGFFAQRLPAPVKSAKSEPKPATPVKAEDEETPEAVDSPATVDVAVTAPAVALPAAPPAVPAAIAERPNQTAVPVTAKPSKAAPTAASPPEAMAAPLAAKVEAPVVTATGPVQTEVAKPEVAKPEVAKPEVAAFEAVPPEAAPSVDSRPAAPESAPLAIVRTVEAPIASAAFAEAFAVRQPAATPPLAAAAPQPVPSMAVALDDLFVAAAPDSAWVDRLASDITVLASGESREAHLKINPRSLGKMSIKLEIEGQRTRVAFTVETPQALSMMTDGAPRLVQIVEANGLKLDGATVDLDQRRDGRAAPDQQQREAPEPQRASARARDEVAHLVSHTRIITAHERYA